MIALFGFTWRSVGMLIDSLFESILYSLWQVCSSDQCGFDNYMVGQSREGGEVYAGDTYMFKERPRWGGRRCCMHGQGAASG